MNQISGASTSIVPVTELWFPGQGGKLRQRQGLLLDEARCCYGEITPEVPTLGRHVFSSEGSGGGHSQRADTESGLAIPVSSELLRWVVPHSTVVGHILFSCF